MSNNFPVQFISSQNDTEFLSNTIREEELDNYDWSSCSFIAIDATEQSKAYSALQTIRQHKLAKLYLRPVLFITRDGQPLSWKLNAADGAISSSPGQVINSIDWENHFYDINNWINNIVEDEASPENNLPIRILRMMASRNMLAEPIKTAENSNGFVYPQLQALFKAQDMGTLQMLAILEQQNLIAPKLIDRAHFCNHCDSAFLNFKEICAKCDSHDIETLELVHHFKCSHTAEITQFKSTQEGLHCPKCDTHLRHIGVDYDKPSTVIKCNECSYVGQDSKVIAQCYQCSRTVDSELLDVRRINSYKATSVGINAAYYGLTTYFTDILESEMQLLTLKEFELVVDIEGARIKRYKKSESTLAIIQLVDLDTIYLSLGNRAKQVFTELAEIFKSVFRESDAITAYNESVFTVLMTETSKENADIAIERLKNSTEMLFAQNFNREQQISFSTSTINGEQDVKQMLENFLDSEGENLD
ncbi:TackOD1 domain-containing metal-binding protein [Thalassotalea montiporae]